MEATGGLNRGDGTACGCASTAALQPSPAPTASLRLRHQRRQRQHLDLSFIYFNLKGLLLLDEHERQRSSPSLGMSLAPTGVERAGGHGHSIGCAVGGGAFGGAFNVLVLLSGTRCCACAQSGEILLWRSGGLPSLGACLWVMGGQVLHT